MIYEQVKIIRDKEGYFKVEVSFREPFEYFFEFASHKAKFENVIDANRLVERVREKFKEIGLSKSLSFALDKDLWNYTSSAYNRHKHFNEEYVVPISDRAKAIIARD